MAAMSSIHRSPCKRCPSAHYPADSEAEDIKDMYAKGEITARESVFPCAWRPNKICKGVCDYHGIGEKDL